MEREVAVMAFNTMAFYEKNGLRDDIDIVLYGRARMALATYFQERTEVAQMKPSDAMKTFKKPSDGEQTA